MKVFFDNEQMTTAITPIAAGEEEKQPNGVPVIKTEFDDTMLTLMAYDRI